MTPAEPDYNWTAGVIAFNEREKGYRIMAKTKDAAAPAVIVDFPPAGEIESVDDSTLPVATRERTISPEARALADAIIAAAVDGHTAVGPSLPGLSSKDVTTLAARIKRLVASVLRAENDTRRVSARVVTKGDGLAWGIKLVAAPVAESDPATEAEAAEAVTA